jgi:hypothetical protein
MAKMSTQNQTHFHHNQAQIISWMFMAWKDRPLSAAARLQEPSHPVWANNFPSSCGLLAFSSGVLVKQKPFSLMASQLASVLR